MNISFHMNRFSARFTQSQIGVTLILIYVFGGAFKGILAKLAYQGGGSVLAVLLWRFILSMPIFWAVAWARLGAHELFTIRKRDLAGCCAAGLFGFYGFVYCDYQGLALISASLERIILFTYPVFVIVLNAWLNRDYPRGWQMVSLIIVQTGLVFLLLPDIIKGHSDLAGELWVLASAVFHAIYILFVQKYSRRIGATKFTTYAMTFCFVAVAAHFMLTEPAVSLNLSAESLWSILGMVMFATVLPVFCLAAGIARIGSSRASIISVLGPFVTLIMAHILFGDTLTKDQIFSGFAIIAGITLLEFVSKRSLVKRTL